MSEGGAVSFTDAKATISSSTLRGNYALMGAAILLDRQAELTLEASHLKDNRCS